MACCAIIAALAAMPSYGTTLNEALVSGQVKLDMRLRYETVDDSTNKDAKAGTLRTRLGYQTGDYQGFFVFGEYEDVRAVAGLDDYAPEHSGYATVADPEVTQLNQALMGYRGISDTLIRLGRQRLILDNARFVGNVGWRQNEQTFEALSLVNTSLPHTTLSYAYLDEVKGILEKFDANVSDHLLNASYSGFQALTVTAYAYLLEDDDSNAENDSYGLRLKGGKGLAENTKLLYTAEFARQSTNDNDANYTFLEAGVQYRKVTAKLGYEVLGSDDGAYGFQTPLATKHAFNGWADMFLSTPGDGLRDLMLSAGGKMAGIKLLAVYHDFSADQGGDDYGSEIDLLAAKKFAKRYQLGIKYASYRADNWKTDTDKLWLWGQLRL
ncbi:MAG: alginate export family protein [Gammaproteobacteria bacterium]